jgi:predicted amidohydrolase
MIIKVAACQLVLSIENPEENFLSICNAVSNCVAADAQLIVIPELSNSGYVFKNLTELAERAWELSDRRFEKLKAILSTSDAILVGGFALSVLGEYFNASVVVDKSGVRGWYPKAHLFNDEKDFFMAGSDQPLIVDTPIGRLATMICYDVEFPEWVRKAALAGAQILAIPTNWPEWGGIAIPTPMEVVRVQAGASVNRMVAIAADRTGEERGVKWVGASVITDADGVIQVMADLKIPNTTQILFAEVEVPTSKAIGPRNDVLLDRRTDLYEK